MTIALGVLMGLRMTRVDGITATQALRAADGAPEVIVLTTSTPTGRS